MNVNSEGQIIYEVYPRSFYDKNNDGIGDLQGLEDKLPYIADLGVDYVWISPFFKSPMKDFGYDVSDYKEVDPIFGTMDDFKNIVDKASDLGLKIMIDMVLSHSSDMHPWFKESRTSKTNPKADWYVWADAKDPKQPPNNWLSVFGNSSWQYDEQRQQFYLHNFLKEQPDLNFHNPNVQTALLDICEFWLKLGVKGFRLDTVNFYFHDQKLRSNPLIDKQNIIVHDAPQINPYTDQDHIYDKNQPENIAFLKKLRKLADNYDCVLLGEVGENLRSMEIVTAYTKGNNLLHLCYSFDFIGAPFKARYFENTINKFWQASKDSMICNSFGNHDCVRLISRWHPNPAYENDFGKLCCAILMTLKGACCIYQGEELGLSEYEITSKEEIQDPYGLSFYPEFKGRDGCRTPMVWNNDQPNAGFNKGAKTWLKIPHDHLKKTASQQEKAAGSLLKFYQTMIKIKKNEPILMFGDIKANVLENQVLKIERSLDGKTIIGFFNFADTPISIKDSENGEPIFTEVSAKNNHQQLGPYQFYFIRSL